MILYLLYQALKMDFKTFEVSFIAGELLFSIVMLPFIIFLDILIMPYTICYLIAYKIKKQVFKEIELKIENIKCIAYNGKTIEFSIKIKNLNKEKKEKLLEIACKEKYKKITLEMQD